MALYQHSIKSESQEESYVAIGRDEEGIEALIIARGLMFQ